MYACVCVYVCVHVCVCARTYQWQPLSLLRLQLPRMQAGSLNHAAAAAVLGCCDVSHAVAAAAFGPDSTAATAAAAAAAAAAVAVAVAVAVAAGLNVPGPA